MEKTDSPVYIGIGDPVSIRRSLLESLKTNIHCLQRSESVKETRHQKQAEIAKFRELTSEICKLVAELRKTLPKVRIKKPVHQKESVTVHPVHKHLTELDRLEGELRQIEDKLSVLR